MVADNFQRIGSPSNAHVGREFEAAAGETLAAYYIRTYAHLIPPKVEIWEYDEQTQSVEVLNGT